MAIVVPVILAGGIGSRLWPLSRKSQPKQFLDLTGSGHSMLQNTVDRISGLSDQPPIVVCAEEHRFIVAEQLRQIGKNHARILLEPTGRNTAPAIAMAALLAEEHATEEILLLVLAADHFIDETSIFFDAAKHALELAENNYLVTFGVVPSRAETGYGYIKRGQRIPGSNGYQVAEFIEKPEFDRAQQYLESKEFLWNSGMFAFSSECYLEELNKFEPEIMGACKSTFSQLKPDMDFFRIPEDLFSQSPEKSIDFAVMEHTKKAAVIPLATEWSDLGSWDALWMIGEKDGYGNVHKGDVCIQDSHDVYVNSESRLVALMGVSDLVVIETKDAVLVADRKQSQHIKCIVDKLKNMGREEYSTHKVVYRPWGMYESIDNGERYQVKRITVNPGGRLSVQMHHHRAEHWIVVSGIAKVLNGEKSYLVSENESTYIPIGQVHALENPGLIPLELIEVQSGAYLGEDDIVRLEDAYGRI